MIPVELRSERLVLNAIREDDAARVEEYCGDSEIQRFLPLPSPYTAQDAAGFVGAYARGLAESDDKLLWAIRRANGELAGAIELRRHDDGVASVGYWLGPPHRRLGIMTEALLLVVRHAFAATDRPVHRIAWQALVGNTASAGVARAAGFRFEGTARESVVQRDAHVDCWLAARLDTDPDGPAPGWPAETRAA